MKKIALIATVALGLLTTQAFAKPAKTEEQTLSTGIPDLSALKGLSAVFAWDFADDAKPEQDDLNEIDTEKSFAIGAQYEFSQFYPGLGWQIGGLYELSKDIEGGGQYKNLTGFIELVGKVAPKLKLVGGLNYVEPDLSGASGLDLDGGVGVQLGGTYEFTPKFAFDVRYRRVNMELKGTAEGDFGPVQIDTDVKSEGLIFSGRYLF